MHKVNAMHVWCTFTVRAFYSPTMSNDLCKASEGNIQHNECQTVQTTNSCFGIIGPSHYTITVCSAVQYKKHV